MEEAVAKGWFERWERQQDRIIEARGERFDAMLDVLGVLFDADDAIEVLDLASGPAAISVRVLDRFPKARSVAVDVDPVLLAIGRGTHGDLDGQAHVGRARSPRSGVDRRGACRRRAPARRRRAQQHRAALDPEWRPRRRLPRLLDVAGAGWCARELRQHGLSLALGRPSAGSPTPRATRACSDSGKNATAPGFEGWEQWWENVAAAPELADLYRERTRRFGWRDPRRIPPRPRGARGGVGGGGLPRGRHGVAALHEPGAGRDPMILATAGDG